MNTDDDLDELSRIADQMDVHGNTRDRRGSKRGAVGKAKIRTLRAKANTVAARIKRAQNTSLTARKRTTTDKA